eukprot:TRINITY_DN18265_c0_g1_i3.p1 TRINITY_DN18265_c0_g1~~TRINITY_DN18265_c0_g1_i3.p1  ORF type:complete len:902 (+),score=176.39 TRINITY_DN18265_c0_g1_i3:240-2945(+)
MTAPNNFNFNNSTTTSAALSTPAVAVSGSGMGVNANLGASGKKYLSSGSEYKKENMREADLNSKGVNVSAGKGNSVGAPGALGSSWSLEAPSGSLSPLMVTVNSLATNFTLDEELRKMELLIEKSSDPLNDCLGYINTIKKVIPQAERKPILSKFLQKATKQIPIDAHIHNSLYHKLWFKHAGASANPEEVFNYMDKHKIAFGNPQFYEKWSRVHESAHNLLKSDEVLQKGRTRMPSNVQLESYYRSFKERITSNEKQLGDGPPLDRDKENKPDNPMPKNMSTQKTRHKPPRSALNPLEPKIKATPQDKDKTFSSLLQLVPLKSDVDKASSIEILDDAHNSVAMDMTGDSTTSETSPKLELDTQPKVDCSVQVNEENENGNEIEVDDSFSFFEDPEGYFGKCYSTDSSTEGSPSRNSSTEKENKPPSGASGVVIATNIRTSPPQERILRTISEGMDDSNDDISSEENNTQKENLPPTGYVTRTLLNTSQGPLKQIMDGVPYDPKYEPSNELMDDSLLNDSIEFFVEGDGNNENNDIIHLIDTDLDDIPCDYQLDITDPYAIILKNNVLPQDFSNISVTKCPSPADPVRIGQSLSLGKNEYLVIGEFQNCLECINQTPPFNRKLNYHLLERKDKKKFILVRHCPARYLELPAIQFLGNNANPQMDHFSNVEVISYPDACDIITPRTGISLKDLRDKLHSTKKWTIELCLFFIIGMFNVVGSLHKMGFIHGNITPENIFIQSGLETADLYDKLFHVEDLRSSIVFSVLTRELGKEVLAFKYPCHSSWMVISSEPWTFEIDLFGVLQTSIFLIYGSFMEHSVPDANWNHFRNTTPSWTGAGFLENNDVDFCNTILKPLITDIKRRQISIPLKDMAEVLKERFKLTSDKAFIEEWSSIVVPLIPK